MIPLRSSEPQLLARRQSRSLLIVANVLVFLYEVRLPITR